MTDGTHETETTQAVANPVDAIVRLRLLHFGATCYDPNKFKPISDVPFRNKPQGGLWTSPAGSSYGWKEWCEDEEYGNLTNYFEVEFNGTLLVIDNKSDMDKLPWIESSGMHFISFQALCAMGFTYDATHLTVKGQEETRMTYPKSLYGWDCESVLVMNPKAIRVI